MTTVHDTLPQYRMLLCWDGKEGLMSFFRLVLHMYSSLLFFCWFANPTFSISFSSSSSFSFSSSSYFSTFSSHYYSLLLPFSLPSLSSFPGDASYVVWCWCWSDQRTSPMYDTAVTDNGRTHSQRYCPTIEGNTCPPHGLGSTWMCSDFTDLPLTCTCTCMLIMLYVYDILQVFRLCFWFLCKCVSLSVHLFTLSLPNKVDEVFDLLLNINGVWVKVCC